MKLKAKFALVAWGIVTLAVLISTAAGFVYMSFFDDRAFYSYYMIRKTIHREFAALESASDVRFDIGSPLPPYLGFLVMDEQAEVIYSVHPDAGGLPQMDGLPPSREDIIRAIFSRFSDYQVIIEFVVNERAGLRLVFYALMEDMPRDDYRIWRGGILIFILVLLISSALAGLVLRRTNRSILALEEATRNVAQGNLDFDLVPRGDDEIADLTRSFDGMRRDLKEELARRSRFLMAVSHDLKTPLTSIEGYVEAITDGLARDEETKSRYLGIIGDKARLLEGRILELIDFVRMETGEWQLKAEEIPLSGFLERLSSAYEEDAKVMKRRFASAIEIPADTMVSGDPSLITRVMDNLFSNAVRYSRDDDTITLGAGSGPSGIDVSVSDTGPGIAADELPRIFDPFFRGTRTRNEQGFGLGLSIVKSIIEAHGFRIGVSSFPGSETRFSIEIPAARGASGIVP